MEKSVILEVYNCSFFNSGYTFDKEIEDRYPSLKNYIINVCYEINRMYLSRININNVLEESGSNYAIICDESNIYIIDVGFSVMNGICLAKAKLTVCRGSIGFSWLYLPEILQVVFGESNTTGNLECLDTTLLNELHRKQLSCIDSEVEMFMRTQLIPCNIVCSELDKMIWGEGFTFFIKENFSRQLEMKSIKIDQQNIGLSFDDKKYLSSLGEYSPFYFTYQIPNMKNRPKQESYFVEKRKIKRDKNEKKLYWQLKAQKDNSVFCNDLSYQLNEMDFRMIEKEVEDMLNTIDRR